MRAWKLAAIFVSTSALVACSDDGDEAPRPVDPDSAPRAAVDRFSAEAGTLMVRDEQNGLPGPDEPIDFDQGPFITQGYGPAGQVVRYYNFDVLPRTPAEIYVLFREGEQAPVAEQLNIVDVVPGDAGYNDFWRVVRVDVPADYVANTITSHRDILDLGLPTTVTDTLVNCPVVPAGSTATRRLGGAATQLVRGWYRGEVIQYFSFEESLALQGDQVPVSPIFVTFNINPDQPGGGPLSGFRTEEGSAQTHNVVATLPGDAAYSPLWSVSVYDNADFDTVTDLASISNATVLAQGVADVNCPVVEIESP